MILLITEYIIQGDIFVSLLESILLGIAVIIFLIMLFKQSRLLHFFIFYALVCVALFLIRVIEHTPVKTAFFDSFGLAGIIVLIYLLVTLFKRSHLKQKQFYRALTKRKDPSLYKEIVGSLFMGSYNQKVKKSTVFAKNLAVVLPKPAFLNP